MTKSVLINASNLHVGGGVQVAVSFIRELSELQNLAPQVEFTLFLSSKVYENLSKTGFDFETLPNHQILDVYGLQALNPNIGSRFIGFDLIFTIFGPSYLPFPVRNHIVGFAQAWIIYPNNDASKRLNPWRRLVARFRFLLKWHFFKIADRLVVELEHVKTGLMTKKKFPADRIDVVSNCVSDLYFDPSRWAPISSLNDLQGDFVKIGIISRDYEHKNLDFIPKIATELEKISNKNYRFFVTLDDNEWLRKNSRFQESVLNVGPLNVAQCPTFYRSMDAVIFPSLLESFSATPIEALAMRRPLFASSRPFVKDCCGENAIYFDPLDACDAARKIIEWFEEFSSSAREKLIEKAYLHMRSLPDGRERARAYIEIIKRQLFL